MYNCVKLKEKDNVATVTKALNAGEKAEYRFKGEDFEIEVKENIPLYHKIALGYALEDIKKGTHVHTENLDSKMI